MIRKWYLVPARQLSNFSLSVLMDVIRPCHKGENKPMVQTFETFDETFLNFLAYKCKYMVDLGVLLEHALHGRYCGTLRMTGDPFQGVTTSFVLPRNSPYSHVFSNSTLELRDADLIPTPARYLEREGSCIESEFISIGFTKLVWFFILVLLAITISLVIILLQVLSGPSK